MKPLKTLCLLAFITISINPGLDAQSLSAYVNPFIGTGGHGHTFPGATTPFGMVQLSPDTYLEGWDWVSGYHYTDSSIMGFSHTHISGTGLGDFADVLLMPTIGEVQLKPGSRENPAEGYRSAFSHTDEEAAPGYYKVLLKESNIQAELTATAHCGMHQYTFPKSSNSNVVIDLFHGISSHVMKARLTVEDSVTLAGYRISGGWADLQPVYFVAKFSKPFKAYGTAINNQLLWGVSDARNGAHPAQANIKGAVRFNTEAGEQLVVKVGISMTSIENARENLQAEIPGWDFEEVRKQTGDEWEQQLAKFNVEGGEKQKEIFYTAIYHSLVTPNQIADTDGSFIGPDDRLDTSATKKYYSTFSLWDTYRATHPFYTLIMPDKTAEMIHSMLLHYQKWGYLPIWSIWGQESHVMIANHAIPVIVDAYFKGIEGFDVSLAYKAVRTSSTKDHTGSPFSLINQYGYIPNDIRGNVSKLLEMAYNDWCVAQMARDLKFEEDYEYFINRSRNYKNIFDVTTGFMRGRDRKGYWTTPFDPAKLVRPSDYTEGNAWQYTWYVPHDPEGLIHLFGSKQAFIDKLDAFFETEREDAGDVSDVTGFIGQYAHGNEPSHHIAYFYNFVDQPWKTQKYVKQICDEMYDNKPDGLIGNEDCGQMSSWYIFSAMGFYPFNPANGRYMIGTPQFDKVSFTSPLGNTFTVTAENLSDENFYIQSMKLNGHDYNRYYITHEDLMKGGTLEFVMGSEPKKQQAARQRDE